MAHKINKQKDKEFEDKWGGLFYPLYRQIEEVETIAECEWVKNELTGFVGNTIIKLAEGKLK